MKMTDQKGFGSVEVIIVILVLALVGGVGYWVYSQQNSKDSKSSTTNTSEQTSEDTSDQAAVTIGDVTDKLDSKITSLASGKYSVEKINYTDQATQDISISKTATVTVSGSTRYRTANFPGDNYRTYVTALKDDLATLNDYLGDTLGLTKTYERTETGPTGADFSYTVYKVGDSYLEIVGGSDGDYDVSWGK